MLIREIVKSILPKKVRQALRKVVDRTTFLYYNYLFKKRYGRVEKRLRGQSKIKVCFFLIHSNVWKFDELFRIMLTDDKFEPMVVICPYMPYGENTMLSTMTQAKEFIQEKGYPYILTYDQKGGEWLDVRREVKPDIVFFTNPYRGLTKEEYYIFNFPDSLTCYVPYSSMICSTPIQFNKPLQNYVWKFFIENDIAHKIAYNESPSKGKNCIATGFPSLDCILKKGYLPKNVWKNSQPIKIIWAPHHTIETTSDAIISFSSFLYYSELMLELANKYRDKVQFAFKPHPILYSKLELLWGKKKTDDYYNRWASMSNSQFENGEYIDLFMSSDALIFDSVSFINEYLYTRKPSLFTDKSDITAQLNEFGLKAFDCHLKAHNESDIDNFIMSLINNEKDPMFQKKEEYYTKYLLPKNNMSASQNIFEYIKQTIL